MERSKISFCLGESLRPKDVAFMKQKKFANDRCVRLDVQLVGELIERAALRLRIGIHVERIDDDFSDSSLRGEERRESQRDNEGNEFHV